ncbi:host cell division inhibitor Icd-like protein [Serratia ureilytica]|uniref:host cell division inhibitor Icd-like protein n=1 Tax=Serratia ureilytica TaxID=300181 RepID=UPI003BF89C8D
MPNKTKAAMPGRQCYYTKLVRSQNIMLIDQVNRCDFYRFAGRKIFPYASLTKCEPGSHLLAESSSTKFFVQSCELLVIHGEASLFHSFLESGDFSLSKSAEWKVLNEAPNHPNSLPSSGCSKKLYHIVVIRALGKDQGQTSFLSHKFRTYNKNALCDLFSLLYSLFQPLGSMPRAISSRRASSFSQLARLVPSLPASASNCDFSSGFIRMWNGGDLPAPRGCLSRKVASLSVDMCTPMGLSLFLLGVHTNMCASKKTTPPKGITSTRRGLTTSDRTSIEVAMLDHTTHPQGRDSLTPNKFTWRFFALARAELDGEIYRLSVDATTEQEARRVLAPHFILSLAARLPLRGRHA